METFVGFSLITISLSCITSARIELDQEHQSMYPYCGKLFGYEWHDATSRVVNSKKSEIQYPWVVFVVTESVVVFDKNGNTQESVEDNICSGTVIGNK